MFRVSVFRAFGVFFITLGVYNGFYKKIDIVWSKNETNIDFILYDEYFNENIWSHAASFTKFKQEKERVGVSYGYMEIPYTQAKEANNFIHKSRNLEKMRILKK